MKKTILWKCWEIMKCENSNDCPARKEPETPCWEIAGREDDFRSAFQICADCVVYMLHQNIPAFSATEYQAILKKKGLSTKQEIGSVAGKRRKAHNNCKLNTPSPVL